MAQSTTALTKFIKPTLAKFYLTLIIVAPFLMLVVYSIVLTLPLDTTTWIAIDSLARYIFVFLSASYIISSFIDRFFRPTLAIVLLSVLYEGVIFYYFLLPIIVIIYGRYFVPHFAETFLYHLTFDNDCRMLNAAKPCEMPSSTVNDILNSVLTYLKDTSLLLLLLLLSGFVSYFFSSTFIAFIKSILKGQAK